MRTTCLIAAVVLGGCFKPATGLRSSSSFSSGSSGSSGSPSASAVAGSAAGAVGSSATSTSAAAAGSTASAIGAASTGSTGAASSSGTSGGTTGASCDLLHPCGLNQVCEVNVEPCALAAGENWADGGSCHPLPACTTGTCGSCTSDDDCDLESACVNGMCEGFGCVPPSPLCAFGCVAYTVPHSPCQVDCLCATCPMGVADAGPPDAGGPDGGCALAPEPATCSTDTDCTAPLICYQGRCVLGCTSNPECIAWGCSSCSPTNPEATNCGEGVCNCEGVPGTACCPTAAGTVGVNVETDPLNCGGCWNACPCGQTCSGGTCGAPSVVCGFTTCVQGQFCYQGCSGAGPQPPPVCKSIPPNCGSAIDVGCLTDAGVCATSATGLYDFCTGCN